MTARQTTRRCCWPSSAWRSSATRRTAATGGPCRTCCGVDGYDWLITMDCDEQHEPAAIPSFIDAIERGESDVISGSRYLRPSPGAAAGDDSPPEDRRAINATITAELNCRLGLALTDGFCGFKAYRVSACGSTTIRPAASAVRSTTPPAGWTTIAGRCTARSTAARRSCRPRRRWVFTSRPAPR
ncbi:MAG: glycosyltransferase [Planctomycetota bacterium]